MLLTTVLGFLLFLVGFYWFSLLTTYYGSDKTIPIIPLDVLLTDVFASVIIMFLGIITSFVSLGFQFNKLFLFYQQGG
jgi:hypothetical protein